MTTSLPSAPLVEIVLPVEGMSCATCVNRIERFLRRADGVETATVNLATERAAVRYDPARIDRAGIVGAIEAAGYDVRPDARNRPAGAPSELDATPKRQPMRRARRNGRPSSATEWRPPPLVWP